MAKAALNLIKKVAISAAKNALIGAAFGFGIGSIDAKLGGAGFKDSIIEGFKAALEGAKFGAVLGVALVLATYSPLVNVLVHLGLCIVDTVTICFGFYGVIISSKEKHILQAVFRGLLTLLAAYFLHKDIGGLKKAFKTYKEYRNPTVENGPMDSESSGSSQDDGPNGEEPNGDKPGEEKPGEEKPGEEKPGEEKPGEEKPGEEKPGEEKPGEEKPGEEKPGEEKPGEEKPGEDKPGEDKPGEDKPSVDNPNEGKPDRENPKAFQQKEFKSPYKDRLKQTPSEDNSYVEFKDKAKRGESKCTLKSSSSDPKVQQVLDEAQALLDAAGVDGIEYKNAVPDFSPVAKVEFEGIDMTMGRDYTGGTFDQANIRLADLLNKNPELASEFGLDGIIPSNGEKLTIKYIKQYMKSNRLTWHELNDMSTIQMVPSIINKIFKHLGGISEAGSY